MRGNELKHRREHSGNKSANRAIVALVAAAVLLLSGLLLSGLLLLVACDDAAKPTDKEVGVSAESVSETTPPPEEEAQEQQQGQQQEQQQGQEQQQEQGQPGQQPPPESFGAPLEGTQFEGLPSTTMDEMPDGDDPNTYALWLIALDDQEFCDNLALISDEEYVASDIETFRTRSRPGATVEETAFYFKSITLLQRANDQMRTPTSVEAEYIEAMQMHYFGEASPWPSLAEETELSSFAQTEDTISTFSSSSLGGNYHYEGPKIGTYPFYLEGGTFQKGLILTTDDPAGGSLPTGHAAILYDELENTAMSSFPKFASRNDPKEEGVQTEPNDWCDSQATCFVLESNVTTTVESASVANWCYLAPRNSKPYSFDFWNPWRRDKFYCSQLVWAGFLDVYGVNIGNADSTSSDWGSAVHPMELKRAAETTLLYQHGDVKDIDSGWVDINNVDRYYVDSTGQHSIGWQTINWSWHYFNVWGVMQTGWQTIEGSTYYLGADGVRRVGWQSIGGDIYYFNSNYIGNGVMQTGWQSIGNNRHYFSSDGIMLTGLQIIDGTTYDLGTDGVLGPSGASILPGSTITPINAVLTADVGQAILVGGAMDSIGPGNFEANFNIDPSSSDFNPVFGFEWSIAYLLNYDYSSDPGVATVNKRTGLLTPTAVGTAIVDCYLIQGPIVQDQNVPPTNAIADPVQITINIVASSGYGAQGNSQTVYMNTINGEAFADFLASFYGNSTIGYQNLLDPLTPVNDNLSFNFTMAGSIGNMSDVDNFATFVDANASNIQLFEAGVGGVPVGETLAQLETDNSGALFFDMAPAQSHMLTLNIETGSLNLAPGLYVLRFTPEFQGSINSSRFLGVNVDFVFSI